jgi:hypothetical protein
MIPTSRRWRLSWPVRRQNFVVREMNGLRGRVIDRDRGLHGVLKRLIVVSFVLAFFAAARVFLRSRTDTALEVLALRQQVAVLKRRRPRPPVSALDRLF